MTQTLILYMKENTIFTWLDRDVRLNESMDEALRNFLQADKHKNIQLM